MRARIPWRSRHASTSRCINVCHRLRDETYSSRTFEGSAVAVLLGAAAVLGLNEALGGRAAQKES